ncbi:KICSTOR complex protein kaptin [Chionoecetes opilio]|uniref:KICSTOR complex protein kaptin n=1 Tax=Chionoecetes opilio TaxID=41210 RepID=A0A8J4YDG4_CHIOP|nr:KICSTOR complex protein kaptin [Chionoecetes opilio]
MDTRTRKETPEKGINFIDAHFFSLPSQGNVYTLSPLTDAQGYSKLLVTSLQRKASVSKRASDSNNFGTGNVNNAPWNQQNSCHARSEMVHTTLKKIFCLEYKNGRPCMREYPFTYIPAGAEIVSIDAVNRSVIQEDFIIGITIIKKEDGKGEQSQFFNIYSDWDLNSDSALEVVSQNCLTLNLDFVPYHLYHTQTNIKNGWQVVFVFSSLIFYTVQGCMAKDVART